MKISVNWIRLMNKNYGCSDSSELDDIGLLVKKIGAQLGEVESVENLGEKYHGIVVAKVVECEKHPNADKLSLCKIDDGGRAKNIERDGNGLVQVVCGAPNVRAGFMVAWLPPGSTVPSTFASDQFVLEEREIRGVKSHGMLASAKELALGDSHDGILELDASSEPGDDFAQALQLNDYIIDIENKMFTHRPDCFGFMGVAREIAGIFGKPFKSPDWYQQGATLLQGGTLQTKLALEVKNELPELVLRFMAVALNGIKVAPSPLWLQTFLLRSGVRPINNVVDVTNWFMLATGQPLHAYDYDKVKTGVLGVRLSKKGEKLKLLGGKEIVLGQGAITITDGTRPIGLGGVMGGAETEVDESTKSIIFECANFDMYNIRRTSMAYGLFTDAATRFTKGQSPLQCPAVLAKTADDFIELFGGEVASEVIDIHGALPEPSSVEVSAEFINQRLGLKLSDSDIKTLLKNVEFKVESKDNTLQVLAPFWRTDIEIPEDIVEEIGRLHGYDKLPLELPQRSIKPAPKNELLEAKQKIRATLAKAGANEVLTYSFVHGDLLDKVGQDKNLAFKLSNALSPDLQYYRLTLTPSLLDKVHQNIKAGYDEFALFELGKGHNLLHQPDEDDGVPPEFNFLDLVYASNQKGKTGAAFYRARRLLDFLAKSFGLELTYAPVPEDPKVPPSAVYDLARAAYVTVRQTGEFLGMTGEFTASVRKNLKLPENSAGFCVGPEVLMKSAEQAGAKNLYESLSKYPKVEQDISLKVPSGVSYQDIADLLQSSLERLKPRQSLASLAPLSIYQKNPGEPTKQVAFRLNIASYEKTLLASEVNELLDKVAQAAHEKLGAERV